MEIAKFRNVGSAPVRLKHAALGDVNLQPGQETILPLEYATLNVGHPSARNEGKNLWRTQAYKHCRRRWGFYPGLMTEAEWEQMKPRIELYTLSDERLYHVLEDPDGTKSNPTVAGTSAQPGSDAFLQSQVVAMQQQIAQLTALIASQQNGPAATTETPAAAVDPNGDHDPFVGAIADVLKQQESGAATAAATAPTVQTGKTAADPDASDVPPPPANSNKTRKDTPRATRVGGS